MVILGLDISTSTIGWNIFENQNVIKYGYIKLPQGENLITKLDVALEALEQLLKEHSIDVIAAEEALQKVTGGKTTANTVNKLIAFNFGLTYSLYRIYGIRPKYIPASTARAQSKIKIPRGLSKKPKEKKKIVIEAVKSLYPQIEFPLTKFENYKDFCGDIADSVVISRACWLLNERFSNTS